MDIGQQLFRKERQKHYDKIEQQNRTNPPRR